MVISLKEIRDNWGLIAAFAAGAVAWGVNSTMLAYAKDDIADDKKEIAEVKKDVADIRVAAEGVRAASEAQQRATERQIDQLIQAVERLREPR